MEGESEERGRPVGKTAHEQAFLRKENIQEFKQLVRVLDHRLFSTFSTFSKTVRMYVFNLSNKRIHRIDSNISH